MARERCDVVVVGAGIAGLVTARDLVRSGIDSLILLEARDRVGGRTLNMPIPGGEIVEVGGEYAGPTQTAILELADELGIGTFPTNTDGDAVYLIGGSRWTMPDRGIAPLVVEGTPGGLLDTMALKLPLDRPWDAPRAAEWDAMTLEDWLRAEGIVSPARDLIDVATAATLGVTPAKVSLLWFLFYLRSSGGMAPLLDAKGGAQDRRFDGGSQLISIRMAEELGDRVRVASPARRITTWNGGPVIVESDALTIEAQRAVIAMGPRDVDRITFEPALPAARRRLQAGWEPPEVMFKAQIVYNDAFWRNDGLSGQAISDEEPSVTFDNSPPSGKPGVLLSFVDPRNMPDGIDARRDWMAKRMAVFFGDQALKPIDYVEYDWHDDGWTAGCVSPVPPGVLTSVGTALTEPCGLVHWAGTETAAIWNGYMDGAVRSGKRAAVEVAAALRGEPATAGVLA